MGKEELEKLAQLIEDLAADVQDSKEQQQPNTNLRSYFHGKADAYKRAAGLIRLII